MMEYWKDWQDVNLDIGIMERCKFGYWILDIGHWK